MLLIYASFTWKALILKRHEYGIDMKYSILFEIYSFLVRLEDVLIFRDRISLLLTSFLILRMRLTETGRRSILLASDSTDCFISVVDDKEWNGDSLT